MISQLHKKLLCIIIISAVLALAAACTAAQEPAPPSAPGGAPPRATPMITPSPAAAVQEDTGEGQKPEETPPAEEQPVEEPEETQESESPEDENAAQSVNAPDGSIKETDTNVSEVTPEEPALPSAAEPEGSAENTAYEPSPGRVAYITIDDGPSRSITPAILDLLMAEGIKATFFVLPHSGVDDIYQRIIDDGHELGNHSYSHVYSKLYDSGDIEPFKEDALAARNFIYEKFGYTTVSYRFPGGAMGRKESIVQPRKEFLAEIGYRWFDWNLSTGDADSSGSGRDSTVLAGNVLNNIKGRDRVIILMHDTSDKKATLEALPVIIAGLRERGYTFDILRNYPQEG